MSKIEGVPFYGTPPSQKNIGNTSSRTTLSKAGEISGSVLLGYVGRKIAKGAVRAGASYLGMNPILSIVPERLSRQVSNRVLLAGRNAIINRPRFGR